MANSTWFPKLRLFTPVMLPPLLKLTGVVHPAARGMAYGMNAHAVGTARALEEGDECAAFAALAMGALGVLTALLLPAAVLGWRLITA